MHAHSADAVRTLKSAAAATTVLAALAMGPLAGDGRAASAPPTVSTGAATHVTYDSATLGGSVNPKASDTSYYFQFGLTRAYGGQTAIADAGAGSASVKVSLPVTGLEPLTLYHYRLVAVNGAVPAVGADRTFLTTKVPLSLAILSSPNPVPYGGTVTIQGTLSGTGNGNREVVLQANQFPFSGGFQNVGNPELTTATGGFTFPVLGLLGITQFRVLTATTPPVLSPVSVENVAVRVVGHVRRARRPHFARIYGDVAPAENGMQVGILRITHGRGVLVGGTTLRPGRAGSSKFSGVVRARPGVYRALIKVTSGAQVSNYSQPLLIR